MNRRLTTFGSLLALAAAGCAASAPAQATTTVPTSATWTTTSFNAYGLILVHHPTNWRPVKPGPPNPGPAETLGYFTNQTPHAPCWSKPVSGGFVGGCPGPVSTLNRGGAVVAVTASVVGPLVPRIPTNTVVDGQRVDIQRYRPGPHCPTGATGIETLRAYPVIRGGTPVGQRWGLAVDVCYNASGTAASLANVVDRVVRSMRFN